MCIIKFNSIYADIKKMDWKSYLFLLVFLPIVVLALVSLKARSKQISRLKTQYEEVLLYKDYNGIIEDIRPLIPRSYISLVRLSNNQSIMLSWAENWNLCPKHLVQFLQEGDSIYKPSFSDSLFIYRYKKKYVFRLKHRIN